MIGLGAVYLVAGLMFAGFAWASWQDRAHPKRRGNAAFWGLFSVSFLFGDGLGDLGNGLLVLGMVAVAGLGLTGPAPAPAPATDAAADPAAIGPNSNPDPDPDPHSDPDPDLARAAPASRLIVTALAIPGVTLFGVLVLRHLRWAGAPLIEPRHLTLVSLTLGALTAVLLARLLLRQPALAPLHAGRRLIDSVGWAALLPQLLASLGAVFALSGVGPVIGELAARASIEGPTVSVIVYCLGMAGFTMVMGNAFAAFPVMTAGIGLPLIVQGHGGDPIAMSAIGMLSGFCGTLMTPMAANFNLVPAALLELPDRHAVIRAQVPTALALLAFNTVLMLAVVYRQ